MKNLKKTVSIMLVLSLAALFLNTGEVKSQSETLNKVKKSVQTETVKSPSKEEIQATLAMDTFNAINAYRAKKGLSKLVWNDTLSTVAFKRAKEVSGKFSHTRPNGKSYESLYISSGLNAATIGESLGSGIYSGTDMLTVWLSSDFHKQMLESGAYTYIAVGTYIDDNGMSYIVAEFMQ